MDGSDISVDKGGASSKMEGSADGRTESVVTLPRSVVSGASGSPIILPVQQLPLVSSSADAPTVTVNSAAGGELLVRIPVERVSPGTVAVLVNPDGTETILRNSLAEDGGVLVLISAGSTVKIMDIARSFRM